jgi:hypothetical protein
MEVPTPIGIPVTGEERIRLRDLLLPTPKESGWMSLGGRALLYLLLFVWGWRLMLSSLDSNAAGEDPLHLVNLPFHEAGHIIFRPFGQFITSLGGTLGQLLIPLVCFVALLIRTRDPFGASVALWWFGENFLDIAPYIADARAGQLPLVGGNFGHSAPYGFHDWEYLLSETGLLSLDRTIAGLSHFMGSGIMSLALFWGGVLLYRQYRIARRGFGSTSRRNG